MRPNIYAFIVTGEQGPRCFATGIMIDSVAANDVLVILQIVRDILFGADKSPFGACKSPFGGLLGVANTLLHLLRCLTNYFFRLFCCPSGSFSNFQFSIMH